MDTLLIYPKKISSRESGYDQHQSRHQSKSTSLHQSQQSDTYLMDDLQIFNELHVSTKEIITLRFLQLLITTTPFRPFTSSRLGGLPCQCQCPARESSSQFFYFTRVNTTGDFFKKKKKYEIFKILVSTLHFHRNHIKTSAIKRLNHTKNFDFWISMI